MTKQYKQHSSNSNKPKNAVNKPRKGVKSSNANAKTSTNKQTKTTPNPTHKPKATVKTKPKTSAPIKSENKPRSSVKQPPKVNGQAIKKTANNKAADNKNQFPDTFPFWARLKIAKRRTALIIDEDKAFNKKSNAYEDGFVHREATHSARKDFEKIEPNPDSNDKEPMYLKQPTKKPKILFEPHNKNLSMPKHLQEKYDKTKK